MRDTFKHFSTCSTFSSFCISVLHLHLLYKLCFIYVGSLSFVTPEAGFSRQ